MRKKYRKNTVSGVAHHHGSFEYVKVKGEECVDLNEPEVSSDLAQSSEMCSRAICFFVFQGSGPDGSGGVPVNPHHVSPSLLEEILNEKKTVRFKRNMHRKIARFCTTFRSRCTWRHRARIGQFTISVLQYLFSILHRHF